jgi:glycosyltransferase involved in cell wall biosynthesis
MTRRVLLVHSSSELYGSDRSISLLARGLSAQGWAVTVTLPDRGPLADELAASSVPVVIADPGALRRVYGVVGWLQFALRLPLGVIRLARLARGFDVVHVNTSISVGAALGAWTARRPLVWHVRESYRETTGWRWYARLIARLADAVIANSEAIADEVRSAAPHARVHVVENGLAFAPPMPPHDGTRVVTVGRINSWKGQDVLVRALSRLRQQGLTIPATIAGDIYPGGEEHRERLLRTIATEEMADVVALPGFVTDVASLLADARIFVLPSVRPEPFGLALVEAMAAGVACIATDAGGPKTIIRPGVTGLLVPPGDVDALSDAIRVLWSDAEQRRSLGAAAAADVRERFTVERTVDGVRAVYEQVISS